MNSEGSIIKEEENAIGHTHTEEVMLQLVRTIANKNYCC